MVEKFVAKIIEQSLDELRFKNLAVIAPLSATKIDNICRSIFGSNQTVVDFDAVNSAADLCVSFVNAKEDGVLVLKNFSSFDRDKVRFLSQALSERKFSLVHDENVVDIPLAPVPIVLLLGDRRDLDEEVARYFNFWIDISSSELPDPLSDIASEDDAVAASSGHKTGPSSNRLLKAAEIYEWRDSGREPDLVSDLIRIKNVVFRSDEDDDPTRESYEGGILQVIRSYLNYLITAYGYCADLERDICEKLVMKDGVYKHILVDVYNKYSDTDPSSYKSVSEFFNDDDCSVYYGDFEGYMNDQPLKIRREFAYRILVLFDSYQPGVYNFEATEIDLAVPLDIDLSERIFDLMQSVSWKLKQNSQREDVEFRFHSDANPEEKCDRDDLIENDEVDGTHESLFITFYIRITNAVSGHEEENMNAEFEVDPSDVVVIEKINEFLSTQSRESFCYLVYNFISRTEEELENGGFERKYIDYFNSTFESWHRRRFGWASYGIYVEGLSISGRNGSSWTRDDDRYEELFASDWANMIDAHGGIGDTVRITNGWGTYEQALQDLAENQSSSD